MSDFDDESGGYSSECEEEWQPAPGSVESVEAPPQPEVQRDVRAAAPSLVEASVTQAAADYWSPALLNFFAADRARLGDPRPLRFWSACSGMWSEGMVAKVLCNSNVRNMSAC